MIFLAKNTYRMIVGVIEEIKNNKKTNEYEE